MAWRSHWLVSVEIEGKCGGFGEEKIRSREKVLRNPKDQTGKDARLLGKEDTSASWGRECHLRPQRGLGGRYVLRQKGRGCRCRAEDAALLGRSIGRAGGRSNRHQPKIRRRLECSSRRVPGLVEGEVDARLD